jgi:hypothetical protein
MTNRPMDCSERREREGSILEGVMQRHRHVRSLWNLPGTQLLWFNAKDQLALFQLHASWRYSRIAITTNADSAKTNIPRYTTINLPELGIYRASIFESSADDGNRAPAAARASSAWPSAR